MDTVDGQRRLVQQFYLRPPAADDEGEVPWSLLEAECQFIRDSLPRPLTVDQAQLPWTKEEDHFRREILKLVRMQAAGFPSVLHAGVGQNCGLLVLDGHGQSLADLVAAHGPLEAPRVRNIGTSLVHILQPLHAQRPPFLVSEISPSHLYLDPQGKVRLLTFGEAKLLFPNRQADVAAWTSPYTAPERRQRAGESPASDVYSIGATLYFLASGCPPDLDPEDTSPLDILCPGLDPQLASAIMTCLAAHPRQRFPGVSELRVALTGEQEAEAPPHFEVDRTEIVERAVPRGTQRGGTLTVSNAGGGRLSGRVESDATWLSVHPRRLEGNRVVVQFRLDTEGLAQGSRHSARLRLGVQDAPRARDAGQAPDPVDIPVTLEVADACGEPRKINVGRIVRAVIPLFILLVLIGMSWAGITFTSLLARLGIGSEP